MKNNSSLAPGKLITKEGTMVVTLLSQKDNPKIKNRNNTRPLTPITEIINNGFFVIDHKWTVKQWNKAAEKILGIGSEDIIGKNFWEKLAGILPLDFYAFYQQAFLQKGPVHFKEYWVEMDDWFDVVIYPGNNILYVSFKSSNRAASAIGPQQLNALNELYKYITEVTNDCLWEWNIDSKEIFWIDGGHKRVFGYPIENTLLPQHFWESLLHPDDKIRVLERLTKILTEGQGYIWEDEYRLKKANGDYAYVHDRGHILYDGNKACRMIGATQDITIRILLENKLVQERLEKQKEITAAVLTAHEKERADIGKELHDNLGQILAVTKMYIQMAQKSEKNKDSYLEKSCVYIENVIVNVRKIAKNLVIPGIHIIGLFDNIKNLLHDLARVEPIKIDFTVHGIKEEQLNEQLQLNIFRIVQEQLNNIIKHAAATKATINITGEENKIILLISDNGKGFDLAENKKGVGIRNIMSRTELFLGKVEIQSKPGKGFLLKVLFPYPL